MVTGKGGISRRAEASDVVEDRAGHGRRTRRQTAQDLGRALAPPNQQHGYVGGDSEVKVAGMFGKVANVSASQDGTEDVVWRLGLPRNPARQR